MHAYSPNNPRTPHVLACGLPIKGDFGDLAEHSFPDRPDVKPSIAELDGSA